jgi:hypothetical protein
VLGGVDAEAVDAEAEEGVEVAGDGATDVVAAGVEVGEADELAGLDVGAVGVVADVLAAGGSRGRSRRSGRRTSCSCCRRSRCRSPRSCG